MATSRFRCPQCGKPVKKDEAVFPFCSRRCRLIDLGRWAGEEYRIAGEPATVPEDDVEF